MVKSCRKKVSFINQSLEKPEDHKDSSLFNLKHFDRLSLNISFIRKWALKGYCWYAATLETYTTHT